MRSITASHSADREFLIFWMASLLTILSYNFYVFNLGWFLLEIGSPKLSISWSWSLFFLPGLLIAYKIKDLLRNYVRNPYKILGRAEAFKALILALGVLFLKRFASQYAVYGISLLLGIAYTFFIPFTYSVLKQLSERGASKTLSEWTEVSYQLSGAVGILASGLLYRRVGFIGLTFFSCLTAIAASLCYFANSALRERFAFQAESATHGSPSCPKHSQFLAKFRNPNIRFGYVHLIPQMAILIFNIPLFIYIESVMKGGPETFGFVDGLFSFVALLTGLALSRVGLFQLRSLWVWLIAECILLASLFALVGFWQPSSGVWPYLLLPCVGVFSTGLKIHSRGVVLKTHTTEELNQFTVYYQTVGNLFLVSGSVVMGYLVDGGGILWAFMGLSLIIFLFGCLSANAAFCQLRD